MRTIKFLFLSLFVVVAASCESRDGDLRNEMQRFPEAAFYWGELTQTVGEEQTLRQVYIELHKLAEGGYLLSIGDEGTDIQGEPQYILFNRLDAELDAGKITFAGENIVGKLNLSEHIFTSLSAELTADRAVIALDFGDGKVWCCVVDAVKHMLE
jgi:hypothetical protein